MRAFDKAHANRRIISSSFELDPYLHQVVDTVSVGQGAMAKRVKYSPTFKLVYADFVRALDSPPGSHKDEGFAECTSPL